MARTLLYFHEHKDQNGQEVRLEIHAKDSLLPPWYSEYPAEMHGLCGLTLQVQGSDDICAAITKTSLIISLTDKTDEPGIDQYGIVDNSDDPHKYAHWDCFFTPDAEAYLVKLLTKSGNVWEVRWSGYITPDSYEEDLGYRSIVSITARDNLGHLNDYDFDLVGTDGMVSIYQIINGAMNKIGMPMDVTIMDESVATLHFVNGDDEMWLENALIPVALFKDKKWYDVLEETLESLGMVCRWCDDNKMLVTYLRNLPQNHYTSMNLVPQDTLEFYGGTRSYVPAYKKIEENFDYGYCDEVTDEAKNDKGYYDGESQSYDYYIEYKQKDDDGYQSGSTSGSAPYDYRFNDSGIGIKGCGLDPSGYNLSSFVTEREGDTALDCILLVANATTKQYYQSFKRVVSSPKMTLRFKFASNPFTLKRVGSTSWNTLDALYNTNLEYIEYGVTYSKGGTTKHYREGGWWSDSAPATDLKAQFDFTASNTNWDIEITDCEELGTGGTLEVTIYNIHCKKCSVYFGNIKGLYARLESVTMIANDLQNLGTNKVTTVNNETYNVTMNRTPTFCPLFKGVPFNLPENYPSAVYYRDTYDVLKLFPYNCAWSTEDDDVQPLPVQIHRQILCFHHEVEEMLEGECAVKLRGTVKYPPFRGDAEYWYKGRRHLLLSANIDFLSGRLTSGTFIQYIPYTTLWED